MSPFWQEPDFDDHEVVHFVQERASGLSAIIALHSTHLGPAAGGTRMWHYSQPQDAVRDVLRLSRGMSYKNAMAGLPMGGGKAVILADKDRRKTPEMLAAFAKAVEALGGRYVTAADVGITEADIVTIAKGTQHVSGLPVADGASSAGGDPGPFTAKGVFWGIKQAVKRALGKDTLRGVHIAVQGTGSVGGGVARLAAEEGAELTLADLNAPAAHRLADALGARVVDAQDILNTPCDVLSPNALGGVLDEASIARLDAPIVAGGANNQLSTQADGERVAARGILFAPDYVINAGGIISVAMEYLARREGAACEVAAVMNRIAEIPQRLSAIWDEADKRSLPSNVIADRMAQERIGR